MPHFLLVGTGLVGHAVFCNFNLARFLTFVVLEGGCDEHLCTEGIMRLWWRMSNFDIV
jgi:hypothetical protein